MLSSRQFIKISHALILTGGKMSNAVDSVWYGRNPLKYFLLPFSLIFLAAVSVRRLLYRTGLLKVRKSSVPVVVIGNISVGGSGKTPLVVHLAEKLREKGVRAGVVSRGYRADPGPEPLLIDGSTPPSSCGDEPYLIYHRLNVPVAVFPERPLAVAALEGKVDLILSDDGMQHYAMGRAAEIAVIDASRGFGNGFVLPAGPLREPASRLRNVSAAVINGDGFSGTLPDGLPVFYMRVEPSGFRRVKDGAKADLRAGKVTALAAIGNPGRFYRTLSEMGFEPVRTISLPDHTPLTANLIGELGIDPALPLVMTEKDAVKCREFAGDSWYYLQIDAVLDGDLAGFIMKAAGIKAPQGGAEENK